MRAMAAGTWCSIINLGAGVIFSARIFVTSRVFSLGAGANRISTWFSRKRLFNKLALFRNIYRAVQLVCGRVSLYKCADTGQASLSSLYFWPARHSLTLCGNFTLAFFTALAKSSMDAAKITKSCGQGAHAVTKRSFSERCSIVQLCKSLYSSIDFSSILTK
jgi:hypothetical protein